MTDCQARHTTVYTLTESMDYEYTKVLGVYADKMDALSDAHDAAHERQTGYYEDYEINHWSNDNGSESVQLKDITWVVTPEEVQ